MTVVSQLPGSIVQASVRNAAGLKDARLIVTELNAAGPIVVELKVARLKVTGLKDARLTESYPTEMQ